MTTPPRALRIPPESAHVVVVGPVRNCAATIAREVAHLRQVLSRFASVSFLLVESDSSDDSVQQLRQLAAQVPGFAFESMGTLRDRHPTRCERIAICRNVYVERLASDPRYAHVDYVIAADLDDINHGLSADAVLSCWRSEVDWAGMTANQRLGYYDIWALRHPAWSPVDCWAAYRDIVDVVGHRQALELCVASKQIRVPANAAPIEVESAFGGFAVYRRDAFVKGRYIGLDADGQEINEHVSFHADLRAQGHRLYINPAMINADFTEHTYHKTRFGHLRKELMWRVRETADYLHCREQLESAIDAVKKWWAGSMQHPGKLR